jgi:hypothetical protein
MRRRRREEKKKESGGQVDGSSEGMRLAAERNGVVL